MVVSVGYCLCKSQVRSFVIDALKIIRAKLPELNSNAVISEMSEEIVIGLVQLIRSSEVSLRHSISKPIPYFFSNYRS